MLVDPQRHLHVKAADGKRFIDWIVSPAGQTAIASYKINGEQPIFPNAAQPEPTSRGICCSPQTCSWPRPPPPSPCASPPLGQADKDRCYGRWAKRLGRLPQRGRARRHRANRTRRFRFA